MATDSLEKTPDGVLLSATQRLVARSLALTVELLLHLGEIDARKLYLGRAYSSMFAYCLEELGFSEDAAYNRIAVARLARRLPFVLEVLRKGRVHLAGLRLLAPYLNEDNHVALLDQASAKSKRQVEEMVARLAPKPPVQDSIRKLPAASLAEGFRPGQLVVERTPPSSFGMLEAPILKRAHPSLPEAPRSEVRPLAEETFKVQFTASRCLRNKLREAQALLGHTSEGKDLAGLVERAMDLLIHDLKKKRFGVGIKPRTQTMEAKTPSTSTRHVPVRLRREVYARDGGRCTYVDSRGRRCGETRRLEFDHIQGFAKTHTHSLEGLRLLCRAHNQHAAEEIYGRAFMNKARERSRSASPLPEQFTRPGASRKAHEGMPSQNALF